VHIHREEAGVAGVAELVAQLYRADWTRLSLAARGTLRRSKDGYRRLHSRAMAERARNFGPGVRFPRLPDDPDAGREWPITELRFVIAPGGRYRLGDDDGRPAMVCDGQALWAIQGGVARRLPLEVRRPPVPGLLAPQWLIACYDLTVTGSAEVAGRRVHQVTGTPRPLTTRRASGNYHLLDRIDVLVDAELSMLIRSEQIFEGETLELAELHDLVVDPSQAADPRLFRPPPGMPVEDDPGFGTFVPEGPGWKAATTLAGAAASAMGFAVRHAPGRPPRGQAGDAEPDMPPDAYDFAAEPGYPLGDELVNLLHRTGKPAQNFAADVHQWLQGETAASALQASRPDLPQPVDGILGPDQPWDALAARGREAGTVHRTGRLLVAMPGRYRVDHLTGHWRPPCQAVACDGEHTRKVYDGRVATGPATPLRRDLAALADPAWLLDGWTLSVTGEVTVGGRRGYRIVGRAPVPPLSPAGRPFLAVEAVADAELGILLRQTRYLGDRPATRAELRNLTAPTRPGDFRPDTSGLRELTDGGGLFGDRDLPDPVKVAASAAVFAAGSTLAGAAALTGWLQKRRAERSGDGG
jgi:hypothetical protein